MDFFHRRWPVFYEDNHLLVLYKPAGLVIQRDYKNKANLVDLAKSWIKLRYTKPGNVFVGMVHRLDAPVAGVVVMARTSKAAARLSQQFREGAVGKNYLAVVHGRPSPDSARIVHHLQRRGHYSRAVAAGAPGSQAAALSYQVLESVGQKSLLAIELESGRRHQIRAQLSTIHCPIWGDRAYGSDLSMPHGTIALMARRLTFVHPTRRDPMEMACPCPKGWPWEDQVGESDGPLWAIEDYLADGVELPNR